MATEPREFVTQINPAGINPADAQDFLNRIQGNILRPHGRGYCKHIVLTFKDGEFAQALNWVSRFRPTSAWQEYENTKKPGEQGVFKMLALTKAGYDALGIPEKDQPRDPAFRNGWRETRRRYGVRDAEAREPMLDAHCLVLIASDSKEILEEPDWEAELNNVDDGKFDYAEFSNVLVKEDGWLIRRDAKGKYKKGRKKPDSGQYYVEHFGYRDGISNPRFFRLTDDEKQKAEAAKLVSEKSGDWNDFAPLSLALSNEPPRSDLLENAYGSYMVFQKLNQNVAGFTSAVRSLARQFAEENSVEPDESLARDAEALIVGRYRTGEPVFAKGSGKGSANNFDYGAIDKNGLRCPFHAHMRRMNTRGEIAARHKADRNIRKDDPRRFSEEEERAYRIVRRGMPYGEIDSKAWDSRYNFEVDFEVDAYTRSEAAQGLLFMSYQADLKNYEILRESADSANFYNSCDTRHLGIDPIIGQHRTGVRKQPWPNPADSSEISWFGLHNYVTSEYGAYFFAPSLDFLKNIERLSRF